MKTPIIIPQQRKLVVTGCFNCPYCKEEKELDYTKVATAPTQVTDM